MDRRKHVAVIAALTSLAGALAGLALPSAEAGTTSPHRAVSASHRATPAVTVEPGLNVGFSGAGGQLASGDPTADAGWVKKVDGLGAQIVRLDVGWSSLAPATPPSGFDASDPSSPGYNWTALDEQVRELSADGFRIMITIVSAPKWAEGADVPSSVTPGSWEPNAADFGEFAKAIATRYDGRTPDPLKPGSDLPRVSLWQPWNEPNLSVYLSPQWVQNANGSYSEVAPQTYRQLLNAFYAGVKSVAPSDYVVAAGTAPYGDPVGTDALADERTPPVTFDQDLFCLNARDKPTGDCPDPAHFDAIDHHPYGVGGPTWHALNATDVAIPDIGKLRTALEAAEHAHTVAPGGSKAIWVGEVSWNTDPPNPGGVPVEEDAQWAEETLYELWSEGVGTVLWYQLVDSPESPSGWGSTYTSGLYYLDGAAKPAATAFRFPLVTTPASKGKVAWGRAPKSGTLYVERKDGARWQNLAKLHVRAREVFEVRLPGSGTLRAQVAGVTSLTWNRSDWSKASSL